ncbi:replication initiation protein [Adhaeribacter pallidiroseus]|uniref:Replication protein n=1 Tax=Adhaeribacter pallidiroseus TaxID=2072847 RepID=A0A369Q1M1_9BACT|nr:replication initiation protein [Adhaeribacter pallidiroseus]RDC58783.1 Replication protein [Adhaeribacter pallidiroseus]
MKRKKDAHLEIRQHNAITTARYDYSACQLDILFYLLSKLKKEDTSSHEYQIYVSEVEFITGRQWNYQQLREATSDMGSRMFEVNTDQSYKQIWMFQKVEYMHGKGHFNIKLSEDIRPYLFELKDNFTSYQLHSALKLSSKYAKRIYQLASQWKDIGETKQYSIDEFKIMLKLKDPAGKKEEQFERVNDLKKYVLDIAVRQINEHTDLNIGYKLIKQGRAFQSVRFYIIKQAPQQLPINFDEPIEEARIQTARQILETLGIKDSKIINQILSEKNLIDNLFKFNYDLKTGRTKADKNAGGLLLKILGIR